MTLKHLPHWKNYDGDTIAGLLELALEMKHSPVKYHNALRNKLLVMLFQKTSTRTRVSFAQAMTQLGGHFLDMDWRNTQFILAELSDEMRYLSSNADVIMARMKSFEDVAEMTKHSSSPVINGCCNTYHPTQAFADMLTLRETLGSLEGRSLVYVGIQNNVSNSLVSCGSKLGVTVICVTPLKNEPSHDPELIEAARKLGRYEEYSEIDAAREAIKNADAIYTDTWVDMEFFLDEKFAAQKKERCDLMMPFQVNTELLQGSKAKIMHDMPIHIGYEISREAVDDDRSVLFQQAENRMHGEKALLHWLLEA